MCKVVCQFVAVVLVLTGSVRADLLSVEIVKGPYQHPDGLHDTWRVVAFFDDPMDRLNAVVGLYESPLLFHTGSGELYNQEIFDGHVFNDFPSVGIGGEKYDSYVTIGATEFPSHIRFSPDFLGPWGGAPPPIQVILGSEFGPDPEAAWFYFPADGEEVPEVGMWNNEVVIAQFTVDKGAGFFLQTGVYWIDPVEGQMLTPFTVNNIPTPGALVLLGLAALVNRRRRVRGCLELR